MPISFGLLANETAGKHQGSVALSKIFWDQYVAKEKAHGFNPCALAAAVRRKAPAPTLR